MSLMGVCRDLFIPYGYIDADAYDLNETEVITKIIDGQYSYVGISLLSLRVTSIFSTLERIKHDTKLKLIVGGPLVTADINWIMEQCPAIDYAILGEGEITFPNLLLALEGKVRLNDIHGLAFREEGELFITPRRPNLLPGEKVPMPDFQAIDFRYYSGAAPVGAWPSANLLVTRGCPFHCTFCSNPVWNHKPNFVPVSTVIQWLKCLNRLGIREVFFVDDTLNLNPSWFEDLCRQLIKTNLNQKFVFKGPFRANLTYPKQLDLAKEAGFWLIFYGVESGNQRVLDYYKKGETVEELASAIAWTRSAELKSQASLIAGAPVDTAETLLETANFLRKANPDYAPTHPLIPYMGTRIAEDIINQELLTEEEVRNYDHMNPIIRTKTLTTPDLLSIIQFICKDFVIYKKSPIYALRRKHELSFKEYPPKKIDKILELEQKEAEELIPDGVPRNLSLIREDPRLKNLSDDLLCFTSDLRFAEGKWYDCEKGFFRWARPVFSSPFFLSAPKEILEICWSSMRTDSVKIKIWMNEEMLIEFNSHEPGWRTDKFTLGKKMEGVVWLRFEVSSPLFCPGETRELGMAFQSIRFLEA